MKNTVLSNVVMLSDDEQDRYKMWKNPINVYYSSVRLSTLVAFLMQFPANITILASEFYKQSKIYGKGNTVIFTLY